MTNEFSASAGDPSRAPKLQLVRTGWRDNSAIYYDALAVLVQAVPNIARHKNVPVQLQFSADVARDAMRHLTIDDMEQLLSLEPEAVRKAQVGLSHALDMLAGTIVLNLVAHIRGIDNPALPLITATVEKHLAETHREGGVFVWPDLLDAAIRYNATEHSDG